jgi:hypothetical protein
MSAPKQIRLSKYLQKWGTAELVSRYIKGGDEDITPQQVQAGDLIALPDEDTTHPTFNAWTSSCDYKVLPDL